MVEDAEIRHEQTGEGNLAKILHDHPGLSDRIVEGLEDSGMCTEREVAGWSRELHRLEQDNASFEALTADIEIDLGK